jgi:hypothetical protein
MLVFSTYILSIIMYSELTPSYSMLLILSVRVVMNKQTKVIACGLYALLQ